jgi:hypothetical protein
MFKQVPGKEQSKQMDGLRCSKQSGYFSRLDLVWQLIHEVAT